MSTYKVPSTMAATLSAALAAHDKGLRPLSAREWSAAVVAIAFHDKDLNMTPQLFDLAAIVAQDFEIDTLKPKPRP